MSLHKQMNTKAKTYTHVIPEHKFLASKKRWDQHMLDTLGHVKIWRNLTFILSILSVVLAVGLFVVGIRPQQIPYVVEVGTDGSVTPRGNVAQHYADYVVTEPMREFQIRRFIHSIRTVGSDLRQITTQWTNAIAMVTPTIRNKLIKMEREDPPLIAAKTLRREIQFESIIHQSATSAVVDWVETAWNKSTGDPLPPKQYRAYVEILFFAPESWKEMEDNLLALYISGFTMQEINQ